MPKKRGKMFRERDLHDSAPQNVQKEEDMTDSEGENKENEMDSCGIQMVISGEEGEAEAEDKDMEVSDSDTEEEAGAGEDSFVAEGTTSAGQSEVSDFEEGSRSQKSDVELMMPDPVDLVDYHLVSGDRVLVVMKTDSEIFFKGSLQIMVLQGCISCQGYNLLPCRSFRKIFSPRGYSLLNLQTKRHESPKGKLSDFLRQEGLTDLEVTEDKVAFVLKKLSESWMEYLNKNLQKAEKMSLFGRDNIKGEDSLTELEKLLNITVFRPNKISTKLWRKGEEWDVALTSLNITKKNGGQPRLLAAGGKGVGKSSFLRWTMNQILNSESEILYLDLDPGQREFGLPGYLSLSLVSVPVLGPSFCQSEPKWEKSVYFGDINVASNPKRYIDCVDMLLDQLKTLNHLPVLVNTMGWCQGLGLALNIEIIKRLQPTTVVQLNSRFTKKNFSKSLSCDYVNKKHSTWSHKSSRLSYSLLEFKAVPERKGAKDMTSKCSWGIPQPNVLRDIQTLAWLGKRPHLKELPVYSIPYSEVALHVLHAMVPDRGLLAALASRMVDLCHVSQDTVREATDRESYSILKSSPLMLSKGVGIIRGVDAENKLIYMATQTKEEELNDVNCLVGGALNVPSGVLKLPKFGPYLAPQRKQNPLELPWQRNKRYGLFTP